MSGSSFKWYRGLRVQIIALITLAVLPVGAIAIYQTNRLASIADENTDLALLALSEKAVQHQRLIIQRAFGAAEMLASGAQDLLADTENCLPQLQDFVAGDSDFSFVGITATDGVTVCASNDQVLDFSTDAEWLDLVADPRRNVVLTPSAPEGSAPVVVVSSPFEVKGAFGGYASISIPYEKLSERPAFYDLGSSGLVELFTLNLDGSVLTAEHSLDNVDSYFPAEWNPGGLTEQQARSFRAEARSGDEYIYTVVSIDDSPMSVLGVWSAERYGKSELWMSSVSASVFPALMWLACIVVAVMALHTLVIRHIHSLRAQMAEFANNRVMPHVDVDSSAPTELVEIQTRFRDLTDDILREEARLEGTVREQNVLAKEVHHRVKNNLQMIASIMNMQIRQAEQEETVETLQRVQDRISALADVHNDLHSTQAEGRVNVGELVRRTAQKSIEMGMLHKKSFTLEKDIENIWMYPDQVVPLSLLANEVITNAIKYLAADPGEKPFLKITLRQIDNDCEFIVVNSKGTAAVERGTGIGSRLIRAFGIKLEAQPEVSDTDDSYTLRIKFPIAAFELASLDY